MRNAGCRLISLKLNDWIKAPIDELRGCDNRSRLGTQIVLRAGKTTPDRGIHGHPRGNGPILADPRKNALDQGRAAFQVHRREADRDQARNPFLTQQPAKEARYLCEAARIDQEKRATRSGCLIARRAAA